MSIEEQRKALGRFVHRFTREHIPYWASRPGSVAYPLQFDSDSDWLRHTEFAVTIDGRMDCRVTHCISHPTWPDNPELRKK